jgi:hypothetical protein
MKAKLYTRDGKPFTGQSHKMPNGAMHSGKTHSASSKRLYKFSELSKTAQKKAKM